MTKEHFFWEMRWLKKIYGFTHRWDCDEPSFNVLHIYQNNWGENEIMSLNVATESDREKAIQEIKEYYKGV